MTHIPNFVKSLNISWLRRLVMQSEEESSVGDALALAFRCARFCSASLILFLRIHQLPFL